MDNNTNRRVGCYVRVSTENQLENYSIEEQIERLKSYCKAKDWAIYKIYTDGGYSGGNIDRPALSQMLNDIRNNNIDMVVVYKLDRLSRSQKDTLTLIEDEFLKNNVEFVSVNENFDTSTPFGKAMIGILSVFAQLEKDQITERFTMGRIGRNKAGYYHGGATAPTGYNYINGELVIDEYETIQVKEVYDRFISGYSVNSIQKFMHDKYGNWNSHSHILNVLRNSVYIGKVKFKKQEHQGLHEPIIDVDIFNKVQKLLTSSEREGKKNTAQKSPFRANSLLTSILFCKWCGAKYSSCHGFYKCYSRSKLDKRYIEDANCKNHNYKIVELDKIVADEILKVKYDKEYSHNIFNNKEPKAQIKDYTQRLKEIDNQISKMIDLYQVGSVPIEQISSRVEALQKEKNTLENAKIEDSSKVTKKDFLTFVDDFEKAYKDGTLEEKRMIVFNIVERVIIDGENINIKWRI